MDGKLLMVTIAEAFPMPCAAAERTITFPSKRPIFFDDDLKVKKHIRFVKFD